MEEHLYIYAGIKGQTPVNPAGEGELIERSAVAEEVAEMVTRIGLSGKAKVTERSNSDDVK